MIPLGDKKVGATVYCYLDTYDADMASVTITGLAVTDIEIYKDGVATTRASDNGYALLDGDGIAFDGAVGLNGFSIDLSDNSDAGFFAAGSHYLVNVNAITVNAQTVRLSYEFTIGDLLRPATAGRTLGVESDGDLTKVNTLDGHTAQTADNNTILAHASYGNAKLVRSTTPANTFDVSATGEGGLDFDNIKDASGAHTLTNITVPVTTAVTNEVTADMTKISGGGTEADRLQAALGTGNYIAADVLTLEGTDPSDLIRDAIVDDVTRFSGADIGTIRTDAARLTAVRAAVLTDLIDGGRLDLLIDALATAAALTTAQTDLDTLTDARGEPAQGAPPVSATTNSKIDYLYKFLRNKKTQSATEKKVYADDGSTVDHKATVSDNGTIFTEGEMGTGA